MAYDIDPLTGKPGRRTPSIGENLQQSPIVGGAKWGFKNLAKAVATPVTIANDVGARALNVGNWLLGGDPNYFNANMTTNMLAGSQPTQPPTLRTQQQIATTPPTAPTTKPAINAPAVATTPATAYNPSLRPKKSAVAAIGAPSTPLITPDETLNFNRMMTARAAVPQDLTGYIDAGRDTVTGFNRDNQTKVLTRGEADTFDAAYPSRPDAQAVNNVEMIKGGIRGYGNRMTVEPRQIGKPISTADQAADMFNELRSSIDPRTRRPMSLKDAAAAMQNIGGPLYQTPVNERLGVEKNRIDALELPIKQKHADAQMRSAGAAETSAGASLARVKDERAQNLRNSDPETIFGLQYQATMDKARAIRLEKDTTFSGLPLDQQNAIILQDTNMAMRPAAISLKKWRDAQEAKKVKKTEQNK